MFQTSDMRKRIDMLYIQYFETDLSQTAQKKDFEACIEGKKCDGIETTQLPNVPTTGF